MSTDVVQLISDLDAGAFEQKMSAILSDVAAGVIKHGRAGKMQINFVLKQLGNSNQMMIEHEVSYVSPTKNGERGEKNKTQTPVHVNLDGSVSLFPKNQEQLFSKSGEVNA